MIIFFYRFPRYKQSRPFGTKTHHFLHHDEPVIFRSGELHVAMTLESIGIHRTRPPRAPQRGVSGVGVRRICLLCAAELAAQTELFLREETGGPCWRGGGLSTEGLGSAGRLNLAVDFRYW